MGDDRLTERGEGIPPKGFVDLTKVASTTPLGLQVGGNHYKDLKIQPIEFIHVNNLSYIEGCVIKYITRWRNKNGVEDLEKIKHYIDLLITLEGEEDATDSDS